MSSRQQLAKNATALMTSQLATWLLTFALTIFLPRYLGVHAVGRLNLATSLWAIGGIGISFGLDTFLFKEVARQPTRASELVGRIFVLRALLFSVVFAAMAVYAHLAHYPSETIRVIYVIGVSTLLTQLISVVQAVLQGLERMHLMSLGNIVGKAIVTCVSIPLAFLGQPVSVIATTYVLAAGVGLWLQLRHVNRLHPIRLVFELRGSVDLLRSGFPYLLSGAFLVLYVQIDVVIISWFVDERNVGWYGTASQLFGTLLFVPTVYVSALTPSLYRSGTTSPDELARLMRRGFDFLVLLGIPIGFGAAAVADPFIALLYGPQFVGSAPVLALFGIALIFMYQNMLIAQFLVSTDRQYAMTALVATATLCTIPIDLVLIPWCSTHFQNGAIGGALSLIVTEFGIMFAGIRMLPRGTLGRANVLTASKALASGLLMVGAIWWSRPYFLGIPIVIGMVVYPASLLALRTLSAEDLAELRAATASVRRRVRRLSASGSP
jgi:O-antigen/teichoic acid export membrane protein